jgi:DNA-directed RNA polymerase specialized sigma24 family protein
MTPEIAASAASVDTARRMHATIAAAAMDSPADETLMRAYRDGDGRAFEALYTRHKGGTYRYFLRHVDGDRATADELHQDVWLRVIGSRDRYEPTAKFSTWLYTLARHRLIDHWRTRSGLTLASLEDESVGAQAEESVGATRQIDDEPLRGIAAAPRWGTGGCSAVATRRVPAARRSRTLAR